MKRYLSIWMLMSRSTLPLLAAVMALCALVETLLYAFLAASAGGMGLDAAFAESHIALAAGVGFFLWTMVLTMPDLNRARYTVDRLCMGGRALYFTHTAYNFLAILVYWGFQAALLVALIHGFGRGMEDYGPQSMLLLIYRNPFLHSLLPMAEISRYIRVVCFALAAAAASAYPATVRGSKTVASFVADGVIIVLCLGFSQVLGEAAADLYYAAGALLTAGIYLIPNREEEA